MLPLDAEVATGDGDNDDILLFKLTKLKFVLLSNFFKFIYLSLKEDDGCCGWFSVDAAKDDAVGNGGDMRITC